MRTMDEYKEEEAWLKKELARPDVSANWKIVTHKKLVRILREMRELDTSDVPEHELSEL